MRAENPDALLERVLAGEAGAIARLISLIEAGGEVAVRAMVAIFPRTGHAHTVGIAGAPGAGKSTLVDRLISRIRRDGEEVGVLAVDPSSPFTGGAILGDRLRMQEHATDGGVFIRSMATRGHLGGLARATPQAARVLDAAGKPWVLVETVGVGQVEVEIAAAADTTIVVVTPGWGDAVQTSKAGLLEIADVFAVNKADRPGRDEAVRDLRHMLDLAGEREWRPPVVSTVATTGEGTDELWAAVLAHREFLAVGDRLERRRRARFADEILAIARERLAERVDTLAGAGVLEGLTRLVAARQLDPYTAACRLVGRDDEEGGRDG